LPKPAKGNGRLQRACRRVLWAHDGQCSTSVIIDWCYARRLLILGERRRNGFNVAVRRALEAISAERCGRAATIGRPILWRLRSPWRYPCGWQMMKCKQLQTLAATDRWHQIID